MDVPSHDSHELGNHTYDDGPPPHVPGAIIDVPEITGENTPLEPLSVTALPEAVVPHPQFDTVDDPLNTQSAPQWIADAVHEAGRHRETAGRLVYPVATYFDIDSHHPSPDDVLAFEFSRADLTIPPNVVPFDTKADLQSALGVLYADFEKECGGTIPGRTLTAEEVAQEQADHEAAHQQAILAVHQQGAAADGTDGQVESFFAVVQAEREGVQSFKPMNISPGWRTTRLGMAIVSAAPDPPSLGDSDNIRSDGFDNVQAVADEAKRQGMPLPESLQKLVDSDGAPDPSRTVSTLIGSDSSTELKPLDPVIELNRAYAHAAVAYTEAAVPVHGDLTDPSTCMAPVADGTEEVVRIPDRDALVIPRHVMPVRSEQELSGLVSSVYPAPAIRHMRQKDATALERDVSREVSRSHVAASLGYDQGFFGIVATYQRPAQEVTLDIRFFAPGLETSKLGAALINVGVTSPTQENLWAMRDLGFDSIEEVAQAAHAEGLPIPLPLQKFVDSP